MPDATPQVNLTDLFKVTMSLMSAVEQAFPAGKGKDKFDAVYGTAMAYAPLVNVALPVLQTMLPIFINTTTSLFNRLGIFKHATPAVSDVAAAP